MSFSHGSKAQFWMKNGSGVLTDLSSYLRQANLTRTADTAETSALGTTDKSYIPGLKDNRFALAGMFDPVIDEILNGAVGDPTFRDFEYYPQGKSTGLVKYAGSGFIVNYNPSGDVGSVQAISADFQVNGAVTRSLEP